jgi:hypothetical protein
MISLLSQGVLELQFGADTSSVAIVRKFFRQECGLEKNSGATVSLKAVEGEQTFDRLLGYCQKDEGEVVVESQLNSTLTLNR